MQKEESTVVLLTGGNLGQRQENLKRVEALIQLHIGSIEMQSSIYESAPWGFESENNFLNQVFISKTKLLPEEVLKKCHEIENEFKRVRNPAFYISRTMDVDILFYNSDLISTPKLTIPHLQLHNRRFTLLPLNEIMGDFIHPKLKKSVKDLLLSCEDSSEVHTFDAD